VTRDEGGFKESLSCDLAFADAGGGVDTPGDLARWDVFVTGYLCGDPFSFLEIDSNHLFEVAVVFSNPLSDELGDEGGGGSRKGFRG
jgi:hypothetical protein